MHAEPGTAPFLEFHAALLQSSQAGRVRYAFRPFTNALLEPIAVQGYGVELAIKNLEYKVMDAPSHTTSQEDREMVFADPTDMEENVQGFQFSKLAERYPNLASVLAEYRETLLSGEDTVDNLSKWEFGGLAGQAAQHILAAEDPLLALRDVSQNLPSLAPLLSKLKQDAGAQAKLAENADKIEEGGNLILVNGQPVEADLDIFTLFRKLREQVGRYESLRELGVARSSVFDLLSLPNPQRVAPRIQLASEYVVWLNNLETDSMYRGWPSQVRDILRQTFPGQLHFVAKNFFNLLCVVDLSANQDLEWVNTMLSLIYRNQAPLRFGFLPLVKEPVVEVAPDDLASQPLSTLMTKALLHFTREQNLRAATGFLQRLGGQPRVESIENLREVFDSAGGADWTDVIGNRFNRDLRSLSSLLADTGISSSLAFLNGFVLDIPSPGQFTNQVANEIFRQRREIQEWVYSGEITDSTEIFDFLLQQNGFPSYNPAIFPSSQSPEKFVSLADSGSRKLLREIPYFSSAVDVTHKFTHLALIDSASEFHVRAVEELVNYVSENGDSRFAVLSCDETDARLLGKALLALQTAKLPVAAVSELVQSWKSAGTSADSILAFVKDRFTDAAATFEAAFISPQTALALDRHRAFCKKTAPSIGSNIAVITNGRLIVSPKPLSSIELRVVEAYETRSRLQTLMDSLSSISFDGFDSGSVSPVDMSNLIQFVAAAVAREANSDVQRPQISSEIQPFAFPLSSSFPFPDSSSCRTFESRNLDSALSIYAVLDPLGAPAQRFSSVLMILREYLDPDIRVVLTPRATVSDLPLKNFFRMKLDPISFDSNGKRLRSSEYVHFTGVPQRKVLTMNVHTPAAWLVEATSCKYDLDNILLAQLPHYETSLSALFELNHILVEGSCSDESNGGTPPRGLQLNLGDSTNPHRVDTLVMSNLGYFQLKAAPGVWTLKLADGRASDIYRIVGKGVSRPVIADWIPSSNNLAVEKNPGKKDEPLFVDGDQDDTILGGVFGGLFGSKKSSGDLGETINVFSLASGHLYERFLKIMMLSVVKKTDRPVKFWFLKNFLSPAFKEFIPRTPIVKAVAFINVATDMAKAHNFSVELVTYKWPAWLWPQTEKQRIIWGYKILFLDVLFPLGVKKVIYVDADQVVRTDLKELWDMDLEGAPYGYTPFCTGDMANPTTKGFRFWDHGFWSDHLRGKPYHISALYVVDLVRFRAMAAGDRLRATYDSLARDPNSLANLDQDLPNYMQHAVPIFSLPREWLWCETWCSNQSKENAKTIDLVRCLRTMFRASFSYQLAV